MKQSGRHFAKQEVDIDKLDKDNLRDRSELTFVLVDDQKKSSTCIVTAFLFTHFVELHSTLQSFDDHIAHIHFHSAINFYVSPKHSFC